ncbi:MAG: hypothetical protein IJ601_06960 [Acidaminococcaceae bacterium]|nr:hypothetical protein [Acidaminococcaceae bacterium]
MRKPQASVAPSVFVKARELQVTAARYRLGLAVSLPPVAMLRFLLIAAAESRLVVLLRLVAKLQPDVVARFVLARLSGPYCRVYALLARQGRQRPAKLIKPIQRRTGRAFYCIKRET